MTFVQFLSELSIANRIWLVLLFAVVLHVIFAPWLSLLRLNDIADDLENIHRELENWRIRE